MAFVKLADNYTDLIGKFAVALLAEGVGRNNDECGNTGGRRKSTKYMDGMFRNCVVSPPEVKAQGMSYFDNKEDLRTAEKLIAAIEQFLRE